MLKLIIYTRFKAMGCEGCDLNVNVYYNMIVQ